MFIYTYTYTHVYRKLHAVRVPGPEARLEVEETRKAREAEEAAASRISQ